MLCQGRGVELAGSVYLEPAELYRGGNVRGGMRLREHVLYLLTALDVPVGHVVVLESLIDRVVEQLGSVTLSGYFHDLEREARLYALVEQVYHDVVTRSDNLGNRTGSVFDEILRVAEPYVRTMRQTRDLKQVGEVLRPRVLKHLHCKRRAELRDTVCPAGRKYVLRSNSERFGGYEQVVNSAVGGGYVRDLHSGHILEVLVKRRDIVSQLVELQNRIVQRMEVEVGSYHVAVCLVGGVLYRREVVDLVIVRHNDHSARVLRRGALYSGAAYRKALHLCVVEFNAALLAVLLYEAICCLILNCGNSTRLEHVILAEQFFGVAVYLTLDLAGEVQVDIRRLVSLEAKERFKRYIVAVADHINAAVRTVFLGEVESRAYRAIGYELVVAALRAAVMRR